METFEQSKLKSTMNLHESITYFNAMANRV